MITHSSSSEGGPMTQSRSIGRRQPVGDRLSGIVLSIDGDFGRAVIEVYSKRTRRFGLSREIVGDAAFSTLKVGNTVTFYQNGYNSVAKLV